MSRCGPAEHLKSRNECAKLRLAGKRYAKSSARQKWSRLRGAKPPMIFLGLVSRVEIRASRGSGPVGTSRRTLLGLALVLAMTNALVDTPSPSRRSARAPGVPPTPASRPLEVGASHLYDDPAFCDEPPELVLPTGAPPALSCDDARLIISQARDGLASPGRPIDPRNLAEATADWLDPHGLWSAAPGTPTKAVLRDVSRTLLTELQAPPGAGPCTAATTVGHAMVPWLDHLRAVYATSFELARKSSNSMPRDVPTDSPYQDGVLTLRGPELASQLGRVAGEVRTSFGPIMDAYVEAAASRTAPDFTPEQWSDIVLAAAVRAYIPLLDAHGAWAPLDEETAIYDFGLLPDPPPRLWGVMTRTAVGVRIQEAPLPPLELDDLVLRVRGTKLAGMSVEQVEQFAVLVQPTAAEVVVLRQGWNEPRTLTVSADAPLEVSRPPSEDPGEWPPRMWVERVPYGSFVAAVIHVPDVPDDLGDELGAAIADAAEGHELAGVVLDVRNNGGGSTDGAIDALSLFLPNAAMFPMRRRDGGIEIDRTANLPERERYAGPVAVMIDGNSASAAEMLAGAIQSYDRGIVAGARSYGKGCAQEYLDDDARVGVLRLTTLLYCLPDGSPVQRVGVQPDLTLHTQTVLERESSIPHALAPWRGPDVRDGPPIPRPPWPRHAGHVGPCSDEAICRTLRAIGSSTAASR